MTVTTFYFPAPPAPVHTLMVKTESLLEALQNAFSTHQYGSRPEELYDPIQYIMSLGGKRFRPLLTLLSASIYSDDWQQALRPAMAVEVFHNFTLMHDDIMDKAPLRRGEPTVHEKWNANTAILSGDVMLIRAYDLLLGIPADMLAKVLARFNTTAAEVCEGQQLDMNFETRWDVTEGEYLNMIRLKTSVLLGFALELGGLVGGADADSINLLYAAGENMGIGFQLKDDLLDVFGDPAKFGKQVGGDIISNKKTYLLIEALDRARGDLKEKLDFWINATDFDKDEKVNAVREIYETLEIRTLTEHKIRAYFGKGLHALESLPAPADRKAALLQFAHQLVERDK